MKNLQSSLLHVMGDLIVTHSLSLIELSEDEVLLKAGTFTIDISYDREGVSMVYYDTRARPPKGYSLTRFLVEKRRDQLVFQANLPEPSSLDDFIERQINASVRHLRNAGQDILRGSTEWMKLYKWPTGPAHPKAAPFI